jgi:hypothetical protein
MPRIDLLKSSNRLQTSSPVSIASSAGARQSGEAIADFGDTLSKVSLAAKEFIDDTKDAERKVKLDQAAQLLRGAAIRAKNNALENYKESDGKDITKMYEEDYGSVAQPLLDAEKDPDLKEALAVEVMRQRNSEAESVGQAQIKARVDYFKAARRDTLGLIIQNTMLDPSKAAETIQENLANIDALPVSAKEKAAARISETKNIALASVLAYQDAGKYGEARAMVQKLTPYLGEDSFGILKDLDAAESRYQNDSLNQIAKAERMLDLNIKRNDNRIIADMYPKMLATFGSADQKPLIDEANIMLAQGKLSPDAHKKIISAGKDFQNLGVADRDILYIREMAAGKIPDPQKIVDDPLIMPPEKKSALLQQVAAAMRATHPPEKKKAFDEALSSMRNSLGAKVDEDGNLDAPKGIAAVAEKATARFLVYIGQGMPPAKAQKKALKEEYTFILENDKIPTNVMGVDEQRDLKSLREATPKFNLKINQLRRKQTKEANDEMNRLLRTYMMRKNALTFMEENKAE